MVLPVTIGLAAGIALILLFAIIYENQRTTIPSIGKPISEVIIPHGAYLINNTAFDPNPIKVAIGVNNMVRWVNHDIVAAIIKADNLTDPAFYNATKDFVFIEPN